jgi:hypothetical protein
MLFYYIISIGNRFTTLVLGLDRFFNFLMQCSVGRDSWPGSRPSQGLYLHIGQHKQSNRLRTSKPAAGFTPRTPEFEQEKTVDALNRGTTLTVPYYIMYIGKKNSMASACERTIPTERLPLVSEVSANFLRTEGAMLSA